jgi:hypothetical protein
VSCECNFAVRIHSFTSHAAIIDFDSIAAVKVTNEPVALFKGQAAMLRGYILESELNIGFSAAPDHQTFFQQWNGIATTDGSELSIFSGEYRFFAATHNVFSIIRGRGILSSAIHDKLFEPAQTRCDLHRKSARLGADD